MGATTALRHPSGKVAIAYWRRPGQHCAAISDWSMMLARSHASARLGEGRDFYPYGLDLGYTRGADLRRR